ncbi:MAG: hypothetical protein WCT37_01730 [Patescibacteria group bacterium]|jgi:hypothetical protein
MALIFQLFGVIGLAGIILGVMGHNEKRQDALFIFGGLFLLLYSVYLGNWIFIILQVVFISITLFELIHLVRRRNWWGRLMKKFGR